MNNEFKKILLTEEQLQNRVREIAKLIDQNHGQEELVILGLLKGSYVFTADVVRHINNTNLTVEFIVVSSYHNDKSDEVKIVLDLKKSVKDKNIIILEDIVDTGKTLSAIKKMLLSRGAKKVEIATMCSKKAHREIQVDLDYPTFEIPDEFAVGYGLDYNEYYRQLPYVAALSDEAIEAKRK